MRSSTYILIPAAALLFLTMGCADRFLQTAPEGQLTESAFWKTEEDVRLATNALYDRLYDEDVIVALDAMSDIALGRGTGITPYIRGNQNSQTPFGNNRWSDGYAGIRRVNDLLYQLRRTDIQS